MRCSLLARTSFGIHAFFHVPAFAKRFHWYIFKHKIRERLFFDIGVRKHDAKADGLVVFLGEFESDLPVLEHIQPAALTLHLPPRWSDIEFARHRDLHDLFDGLADKFVPFAFGEHGRR